MCDQKAVHIRGLVALEVTSEQCGSLLMPMIMSKLPNDIRLRVACQLIDEQWKIDELIGRKLRLVNPVRVQN